MVSTCTHTRLIVAIENLTRYFKLICFIFSMSKETLPTLRQRVEPCSERVTRQFAFICVQKPKPRQGLKNV